MKTALLHYWLTNMRGGEKVLAALGRMFPGSVVYTHAFGKGIRDQGSDGVDMMFMRRSSRDCRSGAGIRRRICR